MGDIKLPNWIYSHKMFVAKHIEIEKYFHNFSFSGAN